MAAVQMSGLYLVIHGVEGEKLQTVRRDCVLFEDGLDSGDDEKDCVCSSGHTGQFARWAC